MERVSCPIKIMVLVSNLNNETQNTNIHMINRYQNNKLHTNRFLKSTYMIEITTIRLDTEDSIDIIIRERNMETITFHKNI